MQKFLEFFFDVIIWLLALNLGSVMGLNSTKLLGIFFPTSIVEILTKFNSYCRSK